MNIIVSEAAFAAANAYETLHVPALFQQWAPRVLDAAELHQGQRVLDVACGTGVLAREAFSRIGTKGYVAGLDATRGMLAMAQHLSNSIDWQEGMAEKLPFDDNSFDVVVSQFGLMFFQNRLAAIQEMLRVLTPQGHLAVAVWDALDHSEAYPIEVDLLQQLAGQAAAEALKAPFVLGDKTALKTLFETAGVSNVKIATYHGTAHFPSIRAMVEADLRAWLPVMGVMLSDEMIEDILAQAEYVLQQYVQANGMVEFDAPAHIVTGTKQPH